jgi:hypothetical protein
MKKFYFIMAIAFFAVSCENTDGNQVSIPNDDKAEKEIVIGDITRGDIDDLLIKCDDVIDGKEVLEALSESGVVTNKSFEFYDGEWRDNLHPGSPAVVGFVLEDNLCVIYEYLPVTGPVAECDGLVCLKYDCTYDVESAALLTKSKCHDYTYSAKVIYFKGNTIIFDGVLGQHDFMNEDYASRRVIYLCTLDSDAPAEWKEKLAE